MMMATPIKSSFLQHNPLRPHDFRTPLLGSLFDNENSHNVKGQQNMLDKQIKGGLASSR